MGATPTKLLEEAAANQTAVVNIAGNRLKILPPEIELLRQSLLKLSLENNLLTSLPFEFVSLQQLKYVNLSHNKFKLFPLVLAELPMVEVIDLSHNKIAAFPGGLPKSLKALALSHNRITAISACIVSLPNLLKLDVEENPITYPPKDVMVRSKKTSDIDWLMELKDWLTSHDDSAATSVGAAEDGGSDTSKMPSRSSTSTNMSSANPEADDIIERHARAKERLLRQHDEEIRFLEEQHQSQLQYQLMKGGIAQPGSAPPNLEPLLPIMLADTQKRTLPINNPTAQQQQQQQHGQEARPLAGSPTTSFLRRHLTISLSAFGPTSPPMGNRPISPPKGAGVTKSNEPAGYGTGSATRSNASPSAVPRSHSLLVTPELDSTVATETNSRARSRSDAAPPDLEIFAEGIPSSTFSCSSSVRSAESTSTSTAISFQDVESACTAYFRGSEQQRAHAVPEPLVLQATKTFILANLQLWKAMRQTLNASSNANASRVMSRVQNEMGTSLLAMVNPTTSSDKTLSMAQIKKCAFQLTISARRMVKSFIPLVAVLSRTTDVHILKSALSLWRSAADEMTTATRLIRADSDSKAVASSPVSTTHEESTGTAAITLRLPAIPATMADTVVENSSKIQAVIAATISLNDLLKDPAAPFRKLTADGSDKRFQEILAGLDKLIARSSQNVLRLQASSTNDPLGSLDHRQQLLADVQLTIQGLSRLIAVARIVGLERPFPDPLIKSLSEATRASKEIMRLLPIDWNTPGPSAPSGAVLGRSVSVIGSPGKRREMMGQPSPTAIDTTSPQRARSIMSPVSPRQDDSPHSK